jgi:hypothetical protein
VTPNDFRGLKKLRAQTGEKFVSGIVLHDGEQVLPFGQGLWAVPLLML